MEPKVEVKPGTASVLGRAGPLVLARLLTAVLTISIPLVLARALELRGYGTYKQLFLIVQTLSYVLPFGFPQSVYFFAPRVRHKRPYFIHSLLFVSGGGVVAAVGVWILNGTLARHFSNPELVEYRLPLALYLLFLMGGKPLEMSLTSQGRILAASVAYLISDILRAVLMVVPVLLGLGLMGMMYSIVGFSALRCVASWVVLLKGSTGAFWDRALFARQLAYAVPYGIAIAIAIPQQYAHQYVLSGLLSPEAFAIYAVGCFQLPIVDVFYTPASEVLMVRLGEMEKSHRMAEAVHAFRQAVVDLCRFFFPLCAFLMAAAPDFIGALFGQRFLEAVPIFRWSALGVALAVLPVDGVLRARHETRYILAAYLLKALVTLPLVYFGVRRFGMVGGIISWAIAEVAGKATLFLRLRRALSPPERALGWRELLPWRELSQAMGAAAIAALGVLAIHELTPAFWERFPHHHLWRFIPLALLGGLFGAGYLAALRVSGVRPVTMLATLRRRGTRPGTP